MTSSTLADYFEDADGIKKGELRQNQFGGMIGGPVIKNKVFFFADYEGLAQNPGDGSARFVCPRLRNERAAIPTCRDLITLQTSSGTLTDALGRTMPYGTILDPATTRPITAGAAGFSVRIDCRTASGYARDPFGTCAASTVPLHSAGCGLNQLPAGRLDPECDRLLNLYPSPNKRIRSFPITRIRQNSTSISNSFDTRLDINFNDKNQLFYRFSYKDDPQFIPGHLWRHCGRRRLPARQPDRARAAKRSGLHSCVLAKPRQRRSRRLELPAHHARRHQ